MIPELKRNPDYLKWLKEIQQRFQQARYRAALATNRAVLEFYWELGASISQQIRSTQWGTKVIDQLSLDLVSAFPEHKGFSRRNLYYIKKFYEFFASPAIVPQPVAQLANPMPDSLEKLPWGHIKLLLDKCQDYAEAAFYSAQTTEQGWGREVLAVQIKSGLYQRQGKAISNFQHTLPAPQSELAQQTLKDPYCFDFATMTQPYTERDIERQLVDHIGKFLLELGKGFAFVGKQYHLEVGDNDYFLDLLFYHIRLHCYVVVELKNTSFQPEYAGKLNFYLSAVDSLLKSETDLPTIGILLCRDRNKIETEFALRDMKKPMGVSEFQFTEILPEELKSSMPTIEEIEADLLGMQGDAEAGV